MLKFLARLCWGIIVCSLVLAIFSLFLNLDFLRPQIESWATDALQEKVHIAGEIKSGILGWHPAIVMHDVTVGTDVKANRVALTLQGRKFLQGFLVHADGLRFKGYLIGDYDIPVVVEPTGFEIPVLEGELDGAAFAGAVRYTDNKLHIDGVLKNLPLRKLAEEAEGKVDAKIQFDAMGKDSVQLVNTLGGRFILNAGEGKLTSKSLNFWSRGLLSSLLPIKRNETKLNCAILDFDIGNNTAVTRALVVDTEENTVLGKGHIDLDTWQVDMVLKPNPKDLSLFSVATPVHVTGPITSAIVTPEAGGVAKKIGGMLLGVINPALAILPMLEEGLDDYNGSCAKILQQQSKH